jgi:hypothetical protein
MNTQVVRLAFGSAELGVVLIGTVLGLGVAVLGAQSVCSSSWAYWDGFLLGGVTFPLYAHAEQATGLSAALASYTLPLVCKVPLGLIGLVVGGIVGSDVAAQFRGVGPTSARGMRLVRRSTEWGVFLVGIAVGLCGARLGALAISYLVHGPNFMNSSAAIVTYIMAIVPLGLIGLIGGWILGRAAAAQLWPSVSDERTS